MKTQDTQQIATIFAQDVQKGLSSWPKKLSSKYFYDEKGDRLFQQIMDMPAYYLTNAEFEILDTYKEDIIQLLTKEGEPFKLFELGAGDGKKTKILLKALLQQDCAFEYCPIDISQNALDQLGHQLKQELPNLVLNPIQGTYFDTLKAMAQQQEKKVILFLGSNIGNLLHADAIGFLKQLQASMGPQDILLMGMDQKKNPQTILDAYNDPEGITAAFNKNILHRINAELGANFDVDQFLHWETYDPESGTAKSYLVSKTKQEVHIAALDTVYSFAQWESIHTEISQKYDDNTVQWLAQKSGLELLCAFSDQRQLFKDYLFKKTSP